MTTTPSQTIDFVLVTALAEERDALLDKLPGYTQLAPSNDDIRTYYHTELPVKFPDQTIGSYKVIVMPLLGMGRLQAVTATTDAIRRWHPRFILLVGIAGGIEARGIQLGDIIISDQIVDYELQKLTPDGPIVRWEVNRADPRLLDACNNYKGKWTNLVSHRRPIQGKPKRHTGTIASGDKVIAVADLLSKYAKEWPKLIGVEMEAAGVATATFQSPDKPGFFMIRGVSDLANENKNTPDIEKWRHYACDVAASFTISLLMYGPIPLESKTRLRSYPDISINDAIRRYIDNVSLARSKNTADTYGYALKAFTELLSVRNIDPDHTKASNLPEDAMAWFASHLENYSTATEGIYLQAVRNFYEFLAAEDLASPNLPRIRLLIRQRARKPGQRLPQFPAELIVKVLDYAINLTSMATENDADRLLNLRDRAFLLTLADTGLRVHEACNLRRGDIDWNEGRALVIGKGDRQAVVRFSTRSMKALKDYLAARAALDGASGRPLPSLPVFARHDRGAGKKIKRITTATGRNIVAQRVKEALGDEAVAKITPHSFRHYFVTTVLRSSGNLKLAQELARHRNIAVTQRYAHLSDDELDRGYWEVFEE